MSKRISSSNFKRFGWIIGFPGRCGAPRRKNLFRIVVRERATLGWRIAYLVIRDKAISRLEQHVETFESFEPVKGRSLLFVADKKMPAASNVLFRQAGHLKKGGVARGGGPG